MPKNKLKSNFSRKTSKSEIQSIIFESPPWDISQALTWLKKNKKVFVKVDIKKPNRMGIMQLRFRQTEPEQYKRFTTIRANKTKNFPDGDMLFILGWKDQ